MLVPAHPLLQHARAQHYAVPAFNINNLEALLAVISAAQELRSPIIVQTSEGAIHYAGMDYLVAMVRVAAQADIPVVLHLDHGKNLEILHQAIDSGYTSVMFDGSSLSYDENVRITKDIVKRAHKKKLSVEAELGAIKGIEDLVSVEERDATLTHPEQAVEFVKKTGCDTLAVSIGTAHGAHKAKGIPKLDLVRLREIADLVEVPLVLHGASGVDQSVVHQAEAHGAQLDHPRGIPDKEITAAIKLGIAKVNIDTDLRLAFTAGIRRATDVLPQVIDPRELMKDAITFMKETAKQKMKLFGSIKKA